MVDWNTYSERLTSFGPHWTTMAFNVGWLLLLFFLLQNLWPMRNRITMLQPNQSPAMGVTSPGVVYNPSSRLMDLTAKVGVTLVLAKMGLLGEHVALFDFMDLL